MILRKENKKPGLVLHVLCLSLKQASPARAGPKPPWSVLDIDFLRLPEKERSDWLWMKVKKSESDLFLVLYFSWNLYIS